MVNGRSKGNNYENAICLALSRWLDPTLSSKARLEHLPFRRRSTSIMPLAGHWHGFGDILHRPALDGRWPFCVECKRIEGWTLDGIFLDGWPVWSWWEQAARQARHAGLAPLLLCGRNRKPDYAFIREEDARCLGLLEKRRSLATISRVDGDESIVVLLLTDLVRVAPSRLSAVSTSKKSPPRSRRAPRTTIETSPSTSPKRRASGSSFST